MGIESAYSPAAQSPPRRARNCENTQNLPASRLAAFTPGRKDLLKDEEGDQVVEAALDLMGATTLSGGQG